MFGNLKGDIRRLEEIKVRRLPWSVVESALLDNGFQAVVLHRLAHWFRRHRVPVLGPLVARVNLWLTGVDISPAATIGPGLLIGHGVGLVVGGSARIGARAHLLHQVTIGAPSMRRLERMPTVGDDVFVGAGACLIGGITVGDRVFVGAHAVVTRDIPDDAKVTSDSGIQVAVTSSPLLPAAGEIEPAATSPAEPPAVEPAASERQPED